MNCSNCGHLNKTGARFCAKCGGTMPATGPTIAIPKPDEHPAAPAPQPGTPSNVPLPGAQPPAQTGVPPAGPTPHVQPLSPPPGDRTTPAQPPAGAPTPIPPLPTPLPAPLHPSQEKTKAVVVKPAAGRYCLRCKAHNPPQNKHCGQCGGPLEEAACPRCGAKNPPQNKHCGQCGGPVGPGAQHDAAPPPPVVQGYPPPAPQYPPQGAYTPPTPAPQHPPQGYPSPGQPGYPPPSYPPAGQGPAPLPPLAPLLNAPHGLVRCHNCGVQLRAGQPFCPQCRTPVVPAVAPVVPTARGGSGFKILLALLLFAALAGGGWYFYQQQQLPSAPTAGPDITTALGGEAQIKGGGVDVEDGSQQISWSFEAVPEGSSVGDGSLQGASTLTPSFRPDIAGDYKLRLRVGEDSEELGDLVVVTAFKLVVHSSGQAGPYGLELFVQDENDPAVGAAHLEVPPGIIEQPFTVNMGTTDTRPGGSPFGINPAGHYWVFSPDGTVFKEPARLTLPAPPGIAGPDVYIGHWNGSEWEDLGGTLQDGLITTEIKGFSTYAVFCRTDYWRMRFRNDSSSPQIKLTYVSGPNPDPDSPPSSAQIACPPPYNLSEQSRSWELNQGESTSFMLAPGRYHFIVSYPQPQPGVANGMFFTLPAGGQDDMILIGDDGATSESGQVQNMLFTGRTIGAGANVRPTIQCNAAVPAGVPLLSGDPTSGLPSRIVLVGPIKHEQLPPQGSGVQLSAVASDPEGATLRTFWTYTGGLSGGTFAGQQAASGATITQQQPFQTTLAGVYTIFLTVYDQLGLFDECRWVITVVPNSKPQLQLVSGRTHVEFGRLDQDRSAGVGPIAPVQLAPPAGIPSIPSLINPSQLLPWDGLTLCPTVLFGPFSALPDPNVAIGGVSPVDVMLPPSGADVTNRWQNPGRTCVWTLAADADLDPLTLKWEYPGPIFGSGTYFAAVDVPAGYHPQLPDGIRLGALMRTSEQLAAYNAWVSALYNAGGIVPSVVWEAWDDPCPPGSGLPEPENPCPAAISRGGLEYMRATLTDGFALPPRLGWTPISVGPEGVQPGCENVLFISSIVPSPPDPAPSQTVIVTVRVSPNVQDCEIEMSITGTDGFSDMETIPTNKDGEISFSIPGGAEDVVDVVTAQVVGTGIRLEVTYVF